MSPAQVKPLSAPAAGDWEHAVVSWPDDAAFHWTCRLIETSQRISAIQAVVATGSAVRDVEHSDDLDLDLVHRATRPVLPRPPISVDLRCYCQTDVVPKLAHGHSLLSWTVRFGQPLFERNRWWNRLRADWDPRLLLPDATESIERAERVERHRDALAEAGDVDAAAEMALSALTHRARAALSNAGVFPQSRPELPDQLRQIGEYQLAEVVDTALACRHL